MANIYAELKPTISDLQRRMGAERSRLAAAKIALQHSWSATKKDADTQRAAQRQAVLSSQIHANSIARIAYNDQAAEFTAAINDAKITNDQSVQLTRLHDAAASVLANPSATSGEKVQATTMLDVIAGRRPFGLPMERVAETAKELGLPSLGQLETLLVVVAAIVILPPVLRVLAPSRGNA